MSARANPREIWSSYLEKMVEAAALRRPSGYGGQPSPTEAGGLPAEAASAAKAGGASRDRTGDLKLAKLALSQLSYGPVANERSQKFHSP